MRVDTIVIECPDIDTFAMVLQAIDDNIENGDLTTLGALWYMDIPMYVNGELLDDVL